MKQYHLENKITLNPHAYPLILSHTHSYPRIHIHTHTLIQTPITGVEGDASGIRCAVPR